nr:alpha2x protein [Yata virus]
MEMSQLIMVGFYSSFNKNYIPMIKVIPYIVYSDQYSITITPYTEMGLKKAIEI